MTSDREFICWTACRERVGVRAVRRSRNALGEESSFADVGRAFATPQTSGMRQRSANERGFNGPAVQGYTVCRALGRCTPSTDRLRSLGLRRRWDVRVSKTERGEGACRALRARRSGRHCGLGRAGFHRLERCEHTRTKSEMSMGRGSRGELSGRGNVANLLEEGSLTSACS